MAVTEHSLSDYGDMRNKPCLPKTTTKTLVSGQAFERAILLSFFSAGENSVFVILAAMIYLNTIQTFAQSTFMPLRKTNAFLNVAIITKDMALFRTASAAFNIRKDVVHVRLAFMDLDLTLPKLVIGSTPSSARRHANPFVMPDGLKKFGFREEFDQKVQEAWNATRQMSLVQRANRITSRIPSLTTSGTIAFHAAKEATANYVPPEPPYVTRHLLMPEFIGHKREIFLLQLMIQKQRAEMASLAAEVEAEKGRFSDAERKITELSEHYKAMTARVEEKVARGRISSEAATKRRMELQKEYSLVRQRTARARGQLAVNRRRLEDYERYVAFVHTVLPDGATAEEFYQDPANLMQELGHMENNTLFLTAQLDQLSETSDRKREDIEADMGAVNGDLAMLTERRRAIPPLGEFAEALNPGTLKMGVQINHELSHLTNLIAQSHARCFGIRGSQNLPAMLMLERMANALDGLFLRLERVNRQYAEAKQKIKDDQRLEQRKIDLAERRNMEQKLKADAAVERAQLPIKRRVGRPSVRRVLPIPANRKDPERFRAARLERERIEQFLYGPELIP
jgi:hypothetical protein